MKLNLYADGGQEFRPLSKPMLQPTLQRVTLNKYGRTEYADDKGNIKVYGGYKITNINNRKYVL